MDQWRAFVSTTMNLGVPEKWGFARLSEQVLASEERAYSTGNGCLVRILQISHFIVWLALNVETKIQH
jgi:hypothetical protein